MLKTGLLLRHLICVSYPSPAALWELPSTTQCSALEPAGNVLVMITITKRLMTGFGFIFSAYSSGRTVNQMTKDA